MPLCTYLVYLSLVICTNRLPYRSLTWGFSPTLMFWTKLNFLSVLRWQLTHWVWRASPSIQCQVCKDGICTLYIPWCTLCIWSRGWRIIWTLKLCLAEGAHGTDAQALHYWSISDLTLHTSKMQSAAKGLWQFAETCTFAFCWILADLEDQTCISLYRTSARYQIIECFQLS